MIYPQINATRNNSMTPFSKAHHFFEDFGKSPSGRLLKVFDTLIANTRHGSIKDTQRAVENFLKDNTDALIQYGASQPLYPLAMMYIGAILNNEELFNYGLKASLEKDSAWGFYEDGDIKQQKMIRERWIRRSIIVHKQSYSMDLDEEFGLFLRSFTIGKDTKAAFLIKKFAHKNPSYIDRAKDTLSKASLNCEDAAKALEQLYPTNRSRREKPAFISQASEGQSVELNTPALRR